MKAAVNCNFNNEVLTVEEALGIRDSSKSKPFFTCIHCNEAVKPHKASRNADAHFEHYERSYSCPYSEGQALVLEKYATDHPKALEGYKKDQNLLVGARSASLARERKLRDNYKCQVCGFKLKINGRYVIECHHKYPLSASGERETRLDDLISLCPTCHRIAHTRDEPLTPDEIRSELKK